MYQKGHKTQKKCVTIRKMRLKEVFFLQFFIQKQEFCAGSGKLCADVRLCVYPFQKLWSPVTKHVGCLI